MARVDRCAPPGFAAAAGPPPLPPGIALPVAILDRYVGEYKAASGFTATFRREGDKLLVKPGTNPEVASPRAVRDALPGSPRALLRIPARRPGQGDRCRSGTAECAGYAEDPAGAEVTANPSRERERLSVRKTSAGVGPRATKEEWRITMINRREFLGITAGAGAVAGAHAGAAPRTSSSRAESSFSGPFRLPVRCSRSSASRRGRWVARRCRRSPRMSPRSRRFSRRFSTTAAKSST